MNIRYRYNSLTRLFSGEDLHNETIEGAVNGLSLMNGLILTIPFSVLVQ